MFHGAWVNPFDEKVYHAINGLAGHSHLLDTIMIFFAKGAPEIYAVLFILAWFLLPKEDIRKRHTLVVSVVSGVVGLIINVIIAHVWFRPRPFTVFPKGSYTQLVPHSADASFPSDHVSGSFGFAAATWGRSNKIISYLFTIVAIIVMFARVFIGVHYPTDVLGGLVVGIISSQIVWRLSRFLFPITTLLAKLFRFGPSASKHAKGSHRTDTM